MWDGRRSRAVGVRKEDDGERGSGGGTWAATRGISKEGAKGIVPVSAGGGAARNSPKRSAEVPRVRASSIIETSGCSIWEDRERRKKMEVV